MTTPGDRTLERIAALLNQAEGTDNQNERDVFLAKAQTLATIHSVDLARARLHTKSKEQSVPIQRAFKVGERKEHGRLIRIDLLLEIARANDIQSTISYYRTHVYLHGYEEDINATEALYASLVVQMASASEKYLDEGTWKEEKVYRKKRVKVGEYATYNGWGNFKGMRPEYEEEWGYFPIPKQTARSEFQAAFSSQIGTRLMAAKREAEKKLIAEEKERESLALEQGSDSGEPGTALVLVKKAEEVQDFYEKSNPHLFKNNRRRGGYGGHQSKGYSDSARSAGREAGNNARIGGQGSIGGQRKAISG